MPKTTKDTKKQTTKQGKTDSTKTTTTSKKTNITKKDNTSTKKDSASSLTKTVKKSTAKKSNTTKKKTTSTVKSSSSRAKKKTSSLAKTKKLDFTEYYDLPYRYNQTTVKVLAQTPETLFVYWDISDEDRLFFNEKYGDDFFNNTIPVLLIHNITMDYTFEVEINDFANSWYLHVNDANSKYVIELGRRPKLYQNVVKDNYIYVTSSNEMNTPNNHILFDEFNPAVQYKNIKTGQITIKDFSNLSKFKNMQKIYGIYNLYKQIYKNELFDEMIEGNFTNPSSLSSSQFKK